MIDILAIVGPTASGKSALALELAKRLDGEIISCDSMQIYKKMDIGTAKPTAEERAQVPHRMVDFVEPGVKYSCAEYASDAEKEIIDTVSCGRLPILCGGTGLYLDALTEGSGTADITVDEDYKAHLAEIADSENGAELLHSMLAEIDPEAAELIHKNNIKRVIRTLVINRSTGMTKREWDIKSKSYGGKYNTFIICLDYKNRDNLYERINNRVDVMLENGLLEETKILYKAGYLSADGTASQAIGYKELLPYIKGEISLSDAVENLKMSTRRYAKRQLTWFRRYKNAHVIYPDDTESYKTFEDIVNFAEKLFKERKNRDII